MSHLRRSTFSIVLVLLFVVVLTGSVAAQGNAPIQITILSNFTPDVARGKVFNEIIDAFNQANAGKIQVVSNPDPDWPTLQQKIKTLIAAGTPPDLFLYNYNANDLSREQSGTLMDWSAYLNADPDWKARFRADDLAAVTVNNQIVGIPSDTAPVLFYYHKDLFQKAGITDFPTTWDEFFKDADALKASGVAPIALMTADDAWHTMNAFSYFAAGRGGKDVFAVGQSLDTPDIVKAATDVKQLFGYTTDDAVGANYAVSSANFINEKAAMIIDGPWLISSIEQADATGQATEQASATEQANAACNVGVAAAPTFGDNVIQPGTIVTDSLNPWAAAKQSDPNKEAAVVAWMKYFTSEDNVRKMSIEGQYPMAIKTTFSADDLKGADCLMSQVLQISNAAPASLVEAVRNIKPAAQAQVPSLLEALAIGQSSPDDFANQLQSYNQ